MAAKSIKSLLVAVFSTVLLIFSINVKAQENEPNSGGGHPAAKEEAFDAKELIFEHIMDNHEFHITDYKGSDGAHHSISIPLPVLLYSPQKGFSFFMSSAFEHGHKEVKGYKLDGNKIVSTEAGVKVYDFSLTRNVVQMILALALLVWLMTSVAKIYKTGQGGHFGSKRQAKPGRGNGNICEG